MAIGQCKDIENGEIRNNSLEDLEQPFIMQDKSSVIAYEDEESDCTSTISADQNGSIWMVLLSTFVAVCGSFEFGSCVGFSAPTQSAIREDLNLSLAQYSMFGSILTIGAMLGAVTSGRIADFIGRKGAMRLSAGFCITGWLAVFFAKGASSLDMGRFFTGFGIGIFSYVVPIFVAEIAPKNLRGGLTTLNQLMIVTGASLAFVIGTVISWRSLALTESPRWLAKVGQEKEFQVALQRLRGKDADITEEAAEIQIGVGLMVFQQFIGINGVGFYASETFEEAGLSGKTGTIAWAFVQVPITVVGAILIDKSGRRPLIMAHGLLLELAPIIAVAGVLIYISSFSIGMGAVPWVIMSEIFPIHMKGVAGSLVVLVNWLGAWAVSYTYNFLMSWSSYGTYLIYSGFSIMAVLFVAVLVPETKGKTLEEIQACINADKRVEVLN
ncbi:Sugar transporter ERD6-like 16 [Morus notabilis]|uniref:Sugar transporter ERD6-like 16 n=1 Tax=Morus notabilis TaxID=981085 RepID=W9S065_9ROSA|nr:Sugar transporter ERD6-like 16 [Morus notabilis]